MISNSLMLLITPRNVLARKCQTVAFLERNNELIYKRWSFFLFCFSFQSLVILKLMIELLCILILSHNT